jgi:hypothetical protein
MNVTFETHHLSLPRHGNQSIAKRAQAVFSRLSTRISHLNVTLKDVNGPRGGKDKICIVRAQLADGGQILVVDRSTRLRNAVGGCFKRAKLLVSKEVKRRQRQRLRQRPDSLDEFDLQPSAI